MRIRSDFWVSAQLRLCAQTGIEAVLRRRGAAEAGAIFIVVDRLDGRAELYGPAPPGAAADDGGRSFTLVMSGAPGDVEAKMRREIGFDSDLWWLAIDDRAGRRLFDVADQEPV